MKKRLTMFLAVFFLCMGTALAQTEISGTVISSDDGQPVVGASILVVGTQTGTATDIDGHFSLPVKAGSKITVSYIGMKTQTLTGKAHMKITLDPDGKVMDEVMVVAFGTQSKASFAGSAAVVNSGDLKKKITTNVADALIGSVPGLQLTGGSGAPGAGNANIHIRGIASLYASTDPLIIVDGAPYPASLSNIPQDDIESVTVLKDASSAALYGARGAAGVILITTKKGKGKANINAEMKWGATSRSIQDYDVFTDPGEFMEAYYSQFFNYAFYKQGMTREQANKWANDNMITNGSFGLQYNPYTLPAGENLIGLDGKLNPKATLGRAYEYNGTKYYLQPDDWKDEAYRHGFRQEYNINVSGGDSKMSYYSSVGYLKEKGVLENSGYERFTARLKADYQATNWLHLLANAGYVHSDRESNPNLSDTRTDAANLGYFTQYIAPIYPVYVRTLDANGNPVIATDQYGHPKYDFGVPSTNYPGIGTRPFLSTGNPLGANRYNKQNTILDQLQGQFNFDVTLTPWLKFNSMNSITLLLTRYSFYENPFIGGAAADKGRINKDAGVSYRWNYVQTLTGHKAFGLHDVQLMVGHEWYKSNYNYLEALARGGFSPDIKEINAFADRYDSYSYRTIYNVEGYFANLLYNYDQKYFAQASFRRDASSRFAKKNRWGNFWSIGGAWILSKEKFFQDLNAKWVDNLKLKVSIGQQGNDGIPDFNYVDRYSLVRGEKSMLPSFTSIGNPDITWETTTNFNLGLEFALFQNRLNGEFNCYTKKTTDMLFWLGVPESVGVRGYYGNIGDIRNSGVEFTLGGDIIRTKNIVWSASANISHNRAKALKLDPTKIAQYGGFSQTDVSAGFNIPMWYAEGQPLYNGMMADYAGVNEKGQPLYWVDEDIYKEFKAGRLSNSNKPGTKHSFTTTDWSEATNYTHEMLPAANGGFTTTLRVYDFDLNATFDYQIGGKIYDFGYASLMNNVRTTGDGSNLSKDILKSWTPNNTSTDIPRFMYTDPDLTAQSTRFLTSARFLNFQSFTVGYTVPTKLVRKLMLSKIRLYVQGQNLCFWSARKGLDPRFSFQGTSRSGVNSYAPVRTVMGGLQVSF